jgi:hypothetical protein
MKAETAAPALPDRFAAIEFGRQTLIFRPTRDDFTVASGVFTIFCPRPEQVLVNGARPDSPWKSIDLAPVARNRFELAPLRIELAGEPRPLLCLSVKVWFQEVTNQYDSLFYANLDDRYALVSFATSVEGPDWAQARPRFKQNRVETLEQFRAALEKPLEIRLNQRPLADLERLAPKAGPASPGAVQK